MFFKTRIAEATFSRKPSLNPPSSPPVWGSGVLCGAGFALLADCKLPEGKVTTAAGLFSPHRQADSPHTQNMCVHAHE